MLQIDFSFRTLVLSLLLLIPFASPFSPTCKFGYSYKKHFDDKIYRCSIRDGTLETEHTKVDGILGNPQLTLNEVKYLEITEPAEFNYFPLGFEEFFPDLQGIHIHEANLRVIKKENLAPFPNLIIAYFNGNQLISLEGNLFENNKQLKAISFRDNSIRTIDIKLFDGLEELAQVKFSNNICLREGGDGTGPDELKAIQSAILEQCQEDEDPDLTTEIEKLRDQIASLSAQLAAAQTEYELLTEGMED